jgi:glycine dehydrogenase subunit 1
MYVTKDDSEIREMLRAIGAKSVDDLLEQVPAELRRTGAPELPAPMSEMEVVEHVKGLAASNAGAAGAIPFVGGGAYDHYVPAAVRHIVSRSEFLTAYTPYQPEVSQGTLQGAFEYQSMVSELTGMEVSNASLYDGASACAEAALMARAITGRPDVVVAGTVRPPYRRVLSTYLRYVGARVEVAPIADGRPEAGAWEKLITPETAAVLVQSPNAFGIVEDVAPAVEAAHSAGALAVVVCDLLALSLLKPPGEYGADIAVGEGQPAGAALNFGGPYLGFMATKRSHIRKMPGRIVAETTDADGARGFVMTLQTREQHIRRERATSNICTNEGLLALAAAVHIGLMGPAGLRRAAEACVRNAWYAADRVGAVPGFKVRFPGPFFREFVLQTPVKPAELNARLAGEGFVGGHDLGAWDRSLDGLWLVCVTEKRDRGQIDRFAEAIGRIAG